ncbi:hypothetical protein [Prochlorococcus marinus]|nr:hypothetical protein [Prochlorococcus marinus]
MAIDSRDGVYIGGRDPTTLITSLRPMNFKFFRPTVRNLKSNINAPAFKNTTYASHAARMDEAQDHFEASTLEGRTTKFDLDRGNSVMKELGSDVNADSILAEVGANKVSGMDSLTGQMGSTSRDEYGEQSLRDAIAGAKAMAGNEDNGGRTLWDAESGNHSAVVLYNRLVSECNKNPDLCDQSSMDSMECLAVDTHNQLAEATGTKPRQVPEKCKEGNDSRPGVDDNNGGGTIDARGWEKLSKSLTKDPIINPNGEDLDGGYLTYAHLKQMESDLRNAKDPVTNWGDEHYDNFAGAVVMDRMAVSLKAPATNWGDDSTSTVEVIDSVFSVTDIF